MRHPFSIRAELEIQKNGECFLTPRRVDLLRKIKSTGSILAASKEIRMSYQQAWSFVEQMNRLSPLPVVTRKRGGTNGGGAELTSFGSNLIERYEKLQTMHDEYIQKTGEAMLFCFL
ncbi:MAG: LysR family transcriptional regulator [Bacteroidetes bacterium]|jgi:molybdate transport system regulatory protein|nr:LysR family transcriptional regulator [Bacteroidota bacterium]